jgi:diaminohydroxyphosphoribosylaminopyrimidine deaminase/5-amino-6-(5-phosphoribosylamino)uracil reductase
MTIELTPVDKNSMVGIDRHWLLRAAELSRLSPPSSTAYSVGVILVDRTGRELVSGSSRGTDQTLHSEKSALGKLPVHNPRLAAATLEPCTERKSRLRTRTQLVLAAGVRRVVYAYREPSLLVAQCRGVEVPVEHGVSVVLIDEVAPSVRQVNGHLDLRDRRTEQGVGREQLR